MGGTRINVHRLCQRGVFSDLGKRVNDLGGNSLMGCLGWPTCVVGGRNVAQGSLG